MFFILHLFVRAEVGKSYKQKQRNKEENARERLLKIYRRCRYAEFHQQTFKGKNFKIIRGGQTYGKAQRLKYIFIYFKGEHLQNSKDCEMFE